MKRIAGPLVTIGIPTYCRIGYLKEAVASALAQTYPNIEVLISQNPHKDIRVREEIAAYCKNAAELDARIRYRLLPCNVGPPANFNAIADAAKGEYLMMIGDDDRLLPNAIDTLVRATDKETPLVFSNRYIIDEEGRRDAERTRNHASELGRDRIAAGKVANPEICAWQQATQTESSLIRTRDFTQLRFQEDIDAPDIEFFISLARLRLGGFIFVPEFLSEYRWHKDSTTGRGFRSFGEVATRLAELPVRPEVEPYKRKLLERLTFAAVSQCLLYGEVLHARRLLASPYYPPVISSGAKGAIMKICGVLPSRLSSGVYRLLYAVKNRRTFRPAIG
jgi:glycosyltransferase involved in cell wall biosynthesis